MSETPVLLTAVIAKEWAGLLAQSGASIPGDLPDGVNAFVRSLLAIASSRVVCIEAERLAELREAERLLRRVKDEWMRPDTNVAAGTLGGSIYAWHKRAREALAAQEVKS